MDFELFLLIWLGGILTGGLGGYGLRLLEELRALHAETQPLLQGEETQLEHEPPQVLSA